MSYLYMEKGDSPHDKQEAFRKHVQKQNENIHSFITELRCEVIDAFPEEGERTRQRLLAIQFFRGLDNAELSKSLLQQYRNESWEDIDLEQAIQDAAKFEKKLGEVYNMYKERPNSMTQRDLNNYDHQKRQNQRYTNHQYKQNNNHAQRTRDYRRYNRNNNADEHRNQITHHHLSRRRRRRRRRRLHRIHNQ